MNKLALVLVAIVSCLLTINPIALVEAQGPSPVPLPRPTSIPTAATPTPSPSPKPTTPASSRSSASPPAATAKIPGLGDIFNCNPVTSPDCPIQRIAGATQFKSLGDVLSGLLNILLFIAVFLTFYWLIWGTFQYILAQGEKEKLARARERIKWAIIGLTVVFLAYFVAKFASEIFPAKGGVPF